MAINKFRYYLGPLGYLQALPPMRGGSHSPSAPILVPSGLHTSLSGRTTLDRIGVPKRSWELIWDNLREADRLPIEAAIHRSAAQPLRLIDPRSSNRLPADVSTGGSLSMGIESFTSRIDIIDLFNRTVTDAWSNATSGQPWTVDGTAADYDVASNQGLHSVGASGATKLSYLNNIPIVDPDVYGTVSVLPFVNVIGANVCPLNFVLRGQSTTRYYRVHLIIEQTTQQVKLGLLYFNAGTTTLVAAANVAGLAHVGNNKLRVRVKLSGQTIQIKAWDSANAEPVAWTLSYLDVANSITAGGFVGVISSVDAGNTNTKPIVFGYENFSISGTIPMAYFHGGGLPTDYDGLVSGGLTWSGLGLGALLTASYEKMPILAGSTYRFSIWAKGSAGFKLMARPFDVAGAEQTLATGSTETPTGAWTRYSWLWTPSVGQVAAYFGLQAQTTGSLSTTLWQVEMDQALTAWSFGAGCPEVVVSPDIDRTYWRTKYHQLSLVLREA